MASFNTKSPGLFLAERAAWSDSLGGSLAVPQPELLPIYDSIIPFAFRDALYASSVRLTQKYVNQTSCFTPLAVYTAGRTQRQRVTSTLLWISNGVAIVAEIPQIGGYEIFEYKAMVCMRKLTS